MRYSYELTGEIEIVNEGTNEEYISPIKKWKKIINIYKPKGMPSR